MISSAGMALPAYIGNDNFIILTLLMGIYYVLKKKTLFHLQKQYLLFIGCLFFSMLLVIIGSTLSLGTALSVTSIPLIIYATYKIDPANYLQRFIKLIFYIALISIILFTITRIYGFNSFSSIFPHLYTSFFRGGEVYSYGGFLYRFVTLHSDRNCGPFSEPGQYQCVLSSALYFIMFHPRLFEAKERIRYIIVFFLALITTLSTSGYIGIVILVFCYLLHSLKTIDKRMKYAIIITIIGTMLFMSMTKLGNEFMNTVVFHKIYANGQLDFSLNSGGARTISISSVLTTVYNHPITLIGVGYDELHNMGVEGCAGFLFLLLAVGIMSFSILFGFCFHQVFKYNKSIWDIMVRILLVLNMGLSQPHIMNVALFTMMLYPYFIANSLKKQIHPMSEVANRVLKNSGYLYFSMGLSMFVSLYSTRLILNALGSSDFGIFCIIGGAIGMLGFLNAAMSTTTQRFINYAEGEGKPEKQKSIFTVSISIHFLLSLLMVIIFEIAYFFFFDGILNIPSDRIPSAKWIYQLMLLSTVLTIQTVPYNAIINAHENMRYLSIIGVFQTLMKLVIALIVVHVYTDKLILYGILTTFVSLIFMIILQIYCHRNYSECTYSIHKYHNKELMKEMTSFAGWGFINSSSSMFAQYGMGIVLNSFFGTILSAAQGVANQISGQLMVFSRTMLMAINPIIGKKAGSNDITNMMRISLFSSKMSFLIIAFFAFPFIIETPYILQLWLKNVPEWSVCFFRFEITRNMLDQLTITLTSAINAEGRIKYYSILRGCSYFLPLPISLFLFHLGFSPYWFYIIWIFTWNGIGSLIILYYAHKNCGMQYADFFKIIIYPILLITISTLSISGIITVYMDESFLRLVIILCTTTIIFIISCCWGFVFSPKERKIILSASMSLLKEIKVKLHL